MTVATRFPIAIPQPPARMIVGNLPEVRRRPTVIESMLELSKEYGEIFQLDLPLGHLIVASGPELVAELCDETIYDKGLGQGLLLIRKRLGDGLFTAYTHEPNWHKAHNILMPTFSQAAMKTYVPGMVEIAENLMEALENKQEVDVPDEMTRLTLDTIGLCGFSYRFDSFSRQEPHPFVQAMVESLTEQQAAAARPQALNKFMLGANRRLERADQVMKSTVHQIIDERRSSGRVEPDLLQHMLTGVDKKSGQGLDDTNIIAQCITFLVAGHETTSGLLSFAVYYLLKNPAILERAQAEVDRVFGPDRGTRPTYEQIHSLQYVEQVLKESLRLWPTAPAFSRAPRADVLLGGRYAIPAGQQVLVLIPALHRAASVWPEPERFDPDRFLPEAEQSRPANTFLPFGTGARACIGRQFAMQEAKLVLGMLLHRFQPVDFARYQLHVKQSLTIKPKDFKIKLQRRTSASSAAPAPALATRTAAAPQTETARPTGVSLQILYGSNLGTGEGFANQLATEALRQGFEASLAPLDSAIAQLPREGAAVLICSSYNGAPPDNAAQFLAWASNPELQLPELRYAVFGCGNREWANTYQAVPRKLDAELQSRGGQRILERGEGDAQGDLDGDFRRWCGELFQALARTFQLAAPVEAHPSARFRVEVLEDVHPNPFAEAFEAEPMVVVENRELQQPGSGRSTRHLELALPDGFSYQAGDHLGVIPQNDPELVERVATAFGLTPQTRIRIHPESEGKTALPLDRILSVGAVLTHYVELQETATRHHIQVAASCAPAQEKARLLALAEEPGYAEVRSQGRSLVDLLEEFPGVSLPFGHYLELISPLRPRYYSIASAPAACGRLVSLTVGVVDGPARSGSGRYRGTCSNYLARQTRGQTVYAFLPDTHGVFGLPENLLTPLVMIGAGTGLAPYRGFLQERAAHKRRGPALLFFGCRHPEHDFLYREELEKFAQDGVVKLITAFSRPTEGSKAYVQDRIQEHGDELWQLLEQGAVVYVCGDAAGMASGVRKALAEVARAHGQGDDYLDGLLAQGRLRLDVWASS